jgi:hypothetical protein
MFVSLSSSHAGNACAIKQSIINYREKGETQFFDWLVCSIKSINEILNRKEIIFDTNYIYPNSSNTTTICFKYFDLLISHHDIHEPNENSINDITNKYKRRFSRFIATIKNEKQIFFIRYCRDQVDLEEKEIHNFYENIKNINKDLVFVFILISDNNSLIIPTTLSEKQNFMYIELNNYIDDDILNEEDIYYKIIKSYKCIYSIVEK